MRNKLKLSDWDQAVEYGKHLFGVFPKEDKQMVTGVLHHDGNIFESYVETGNWSKYPNWVREYKETPIGNALEAFINGETMVIEESSVYNYNHPELILKSIGMGNWRFEYNRKTHFRRAILRGDVDLETTAIINLYGEIFAPKDEAELILSMYWDFVDENYEHRQSYQEHTV